MNEAGGVMLPDFRLYYIPQNTHVLSQNQTHRSMNKIENPEIKSGANGQVI